MEFINSGLEIDTDWLELSLYLAVVKDRKELIALGFGDITHTRRHKGGRRPGITTEEILKRTDKTISKFTKSARVP